MVLVDADAVEAEFVGENELIEILVVEFAAVLGVVDAVGEPGPGGFVLRGEVGREAVPGHQVEGEEFHATDGGLCCPRWNFIVSQIGEAGSMGRWRSE